MSNYGYRARRPRRTRFRAKVSHYSTNAVKELDILAYDETGARRVALSRGYTILEIERATAVAAKNKAAGGWKLAEDALREACELLGITRPVNIRTNGRVGGTNGNYRWKVTSHDIMVKSYLDPEQASRTLWHELCHAMQAERCLREGKSWFDFAKAQRRWPYRSRPIEVEARKHEEWHEALPLAR